jgi:hypothetical protein
MNRRYRIALIAASVVLAVHPQSSPKSVLGQGWGLDHVVIGLSDPLAAKEIFSTRLGFSVVPGIKFPAAGFENGSILLPPGYIELVWPYQKLTDQKGRLAEMIRLGGGILGYNIDVSPVAETAAVLRGLGLTVTLPPSKGTLHPDGKEEPGPWQFVSISEEDTLKVPVGVPGGPEVGFLEYQDNAGVPIKPDKFKLLSEQFERYLPDARRLPGDFYANTARRLASVWVAFPV